MTACVWRNRRPGRCESGSHYEAESLAVDDPDDVCNVTGAVGINAEKRLRLAAPTQGHAPADIAVIVADTRLVAAFARGRIATAARITTLDRAAAGIQVFVNRI